MNAFGNVIIFVLLLLSFACRDRVDVKKVAAGEGYLLLDPEGRKLKVSVKEMEIYLISPGYQDKYPETFEINGPDLELVGTFPMNVKVGYGEHFDKMIDQTIEIAASGNPRRRRNIDSHITIPGETRAYVEGGTLRVTEVDGKVLQGDITLELEGGKTFSGTFAFTATTWG
jgi:hypothetical protein